MSVRAEVAVSLHEHAERLLELPRSWPNRQTLEAPRDAVAEAAAILKDAAIQLTAPREVKV